MTSKRIPTGPLPAKSPSGGCLPRRANLRLQRMDRTGPRGAVVGPGRIHEHGHAWEMRPGGAVRVDMHGPDGVTYPMDGIVREVAPPERFVFVAGALDAGGKPLFEVLTTVTFEQLGEKTRLTMNARVIRKGPGADQHIKGMKVGWTQSLERLAAHVAARVK